MRDDETEESSRRKRWEPGGRGGESDVEPVLGTGLEAHSRDWPVVTAQRWLNGAQWRETSLGKQARVTAR